MVEHKLMVSIPRLNVKDKCLKCENKCLKYGAGFREIWFLYLFCSQNFYISSFPYYFFHLLFIFYFSSFFHHLLLLIIII